MQEKFSEDKFDDQQLLCKRCGWKGIGAEAIRIDLYGLVGANEIHCPQCDEKLGVLKKDGQHPGESASDLSFQLG